MGVTHEIHQGEGGEQGEHKSLVEAQARLRGNEIVFAYLDDVYAACGPLRVASVHTSVEEEFFTDSNIRVHHGKTQIWNRGSDARGC